MDRHVFKGSALARKLTIYVVLLSIFATLASTAIQLYLSYKHHLSEISANSTLIETGYIDSLVDNIWVYNDKQINIQLNGMLGLPGVEYVYINRGGKIRWSSGAIKSDSTSEKKFKLIYREGNRQEPLGTLYVITGLDHVYNELFRESIIALLLSAVTFFLVAGAIMLIFRRLVTRHLTKLAHFVNTLDMEQEGTILRLDRPSLSDRNVDELDHVVNAINIMTANLSKSYIALQQEIIERKQAELALQQSNSLLTSIIESPDNVIMFSLDRDYNYLNFNKAHAKEMKRVYNADIEIGQHISSYIPREDDRLKSEGNYKRVLKGERFVEIQEYGKAGSRFWYELIFNPMFDDSDHVMGFTVFVTEITVRKQEDEEKEILIHDMGERVKELRCLYGIGESTRKQIILEEIFQNVVALIPPGWQYPDITRGMVFFDGQEYVNEPFEETEWKQASDIIINDECRGTVEVYYLEERPELDEGPFMSEERNLINGIARAISEAIERKLAEEALKKWEQIFQHAGWGVAIADPDSHELLAVNPSFAKMHGYTLEEIKGMSLADTFAPEDGAKMLARAREIHEKGHLIYESIHIRKDGSQFPVLSDVIAIKDKKGNIIYRAANFQDLTERKKAEEELHKMQKLESVGVLAGGIAHDFNNLLAAIRNNIYLSMLHIDREDKAYENLKSTEKIIHRATNLTQQLLTFARGGVPVKKTASIIELINESAEFVLKGSSLKCEYNISDNSWPIEVDEGQINQVIHNLILNAAQSMPQGGTIRISTENSELGPGIELPLQEGRYLKVTIQDQGTGISEEHLKNIFDPYFTTKEMGHGLGLSITYSIIKNHEGHISVESKLGVGTTFTIYLPASENQVEAKVSVERTLAAGEGKVLLMDDEEIIRESVDQLLTHKGYEVECVKDGDEAIELYRKAMESSEPFNAVILDLTIRGGMGGKETIRKLQEIDPDVKALVASGYSNDPVLANCREYGFCGVFAKHDKFEELGKTLHQVINGNQ